LETRDEPDPTVHIVFPPDPMVCGLTGDVVLAGAHGLGAGFILRDWAGLYAEMDREQLIEGANLMLKVAKEVLAAQTARQVNKLLLQDG